MRHIGILTKMEMAGGSEFRAIELAKGIKATEGYDATLLVENAVCSSLRKAIPNDIEVRENIFSQDPLGTLIRFDHILVINSDSRRFTTPEYWEPIYRTAELQRHQRDIPQLPGITFLFNYIVSPACSLPGLQPYFKSIRLITTNQKFFEEISIQTRYEQVRHYPRLRLESPICLKQHGSKSKSQRTRLGMHSLPNKSKWNDELPELVQQLNEKFGESISWTFMGINPSLVPKLSSDNVKCLPAFALPVDEFLRNLDIFVFFMEWRREEAWARSAGEALASGCPVVTTRKGGNLDQVVHGNNGYLCSSINDFFAHCSKLIASHDLLSAMKANATRMARAFSTDEICRKLVNFLFD